ncbi:MAG: serine/threonine protein kinase [Acidobacteria bacterium]|nr:serine/threonine protein kinase [Acidobacteriota bacterium]
MARDGLLLDVADAVASSEQVDWARARRAARVDQRRSLDSLRDLSRMFAAVGRSQDAAFRGHPSGEPHGTSFSRFALGALVALAALQVTAALVTITGYGTSVWVPRFAEGRLLALISLSSCALLLLIGGRRDHRARLLGVVFALGASSFSASFSWPLVSKVGVEGDHWILPEVFQPAVMWVFAWEFPRVHRRTGIDDLARRMAPLSVCIGSGLLIANLPFLPGDWLPSLHRRPDGIYWPTLTILTLSALSAMLWRARHATAHDARRVALLSGGIVVGIAPILLNVTIEALWPAARGFGDEHRAVISTVVFMFLLSTPCTMTYAVLAEQVLDVRMIVRASYRRLLTRRLLGVTIAAPLGGLGWLLVTQPDRTVADLMDTSSGRLLIAAVGAAALTAACRKRLLVRLDAWVYPETADHRRLLMAAGSELVQATSFSQIGEVVSVLVRRGCGARGTLLVAESAAEVTAHHFTVPAGNSVPLARTSAIAAVLESAREPMRIDPDDRASSFALLPSRDAEWVVATGATAIVPISGSGSEDLGLLPVGRRFDDGRLSPIDLDFLHALAATAGLALTRVRLADSRPDAPPACECPVCGIVASAGPARPCRCGLEYATAPVPGMLAGKFLLERRLGRGGMGAVYLAQDLGLQRNVAIKTLPVGDGPGLVRLRQEARAMAAVAHPAIAQIHGLETWRDRLLLIVEFLQGGTLAARLERGPLPGAEAISVTVTLSEALAALHDAGYVHGDVKPSNIGFASDGTPKLLDFGLARLTSADDQPAGGTLSYMSPEVLCEGRTGEADDVWSLCVVLYEMVTGHRPFIGQGAGEVAARIRRQSIRPAAVKVGQTEQIGSPSSVKSIAFVVSVLTAARSARPATARAFADALREI